jgi:site-specific DNA recombinase
LSYRGQWYPGQHEAIVDEDAWTAVKAIVAVEAHRRAANTQARGRSDALLRGLLYDATGAKLHTTFTRKNGREYRYYVSKAEKQFGAAAKTCERIPADAIESATVAQIKTVLSSPEAIAAVCRLVAAEGAPLDEAPIVWSLRQHDLEELAEARTLLEQAYQGLLSRFGSDHWKTRIACDYLDGLPKADLNFTGGP